MFDWMDGLVDDATELARNIATLVAIASIIIVWYKTKALVPVLGTVLLAGFALWAVSGDGITQLTDWIRGTTTNVIVVAELGKLG